MRKQKHRLAARLKGSRSKIVQSLYFLNLKFQASSHLFLYGFVCVGPGRKPRRQVYSWCRLSENNMSRVMRKLAFCICKNKDADQLRDNHEADQRHCFRYTDSTITLLPIYKISSLWPSSVAAQTSLCRTWSETPKTGFLITRLILFTKCLLFLQVL